MKNMDMPVGQIPAFLSKLWTLLENRGTQDLIRWDEGGTSFHVFDHARFSKEVLPQYFKHNNMASFVRQLNMYGFRKITNVDQGALRSDKDDMEFHHPFFVRNNPNLLEMIKRKPARERMPGEDSRTTSDFERVLTDVWDMRTKQDSVSTKLQTLKKENEALWREVASLRQKHAQQQQIVNKIIQFLVTVAGARRSTLKRPLPLMIEDAEKSPTPLSGSKRRKPEHPMQHLPVISPSPYSVTSPSTSSSPRMPSDTSSVAVDAPDHLSEAVHTAAGLLPNSTNNAKDPLSTVSDFFGEVDSSCLCTDTPLSKNGEGNPSSELYDDEDCEDGTWASALAVDKLPSTPQHSSPLYRDSLSDSLDVLQHDIDGLRDIFTNTGFDFLNGSTFPMDQSLLAGLFNPDVGGIPVLPDHGSASVIDVGDPDSIRGHELIEYHPAEDLPFSHSSFLDEISGITQPKSPDDKENSSAVGGTIGSLGADKNRSPIVSSNDLD